MGLFKTIVIYILKVYQKWISPMKSRPGCRFYPTCSQYAIESITRYGCLKGGFLSFKRLLKCHPFHPGGYDPVK